MRKTVLSLTFGMVAACALTMLTAVIADELPLDQFDDLGIIITEDVDEADDILPAPGAPKAEAPKADPAPAKDLAIAQKDASAGAPAAADAGADAGNISNILAEPALNAPAAKPQVQIPEIPAPASAKTAAEPVIPQLPPVEKSIVKTPEAGEALPPAVTIDPTVDTGTAFDQPVVTQPVPGNNLVARGPAPVLGSNGNCTNCNRGGFGYGGTPRPVYYGTQRNGLPAYPRAGNCCGCGGCGCPGCCGRRAPMPYPYYTLRGPRDFDDPNPRPIGP